MSFLIEPTRKGTNALKKRINLPIKRRKLSMAWEYAASRRPLGPVKPHTLLKTGKVTFTSNSAQLRIGSPTVWPELAWIAMREMEVLRLQPRRKQRPSKELIISDSERRWEHWRKPFCRSSILALRFLLPSAKKAILHCLFPSLDSNRREKTETRRKVLNCCNATAAQRSHCPQGIS